MATENAPQKGFTSVSAPGVSRSTPLAPHLGGRGQGERENRRTGNGTGNWSRMILVTARVLISIVGIAYLWAYSQKLDFVWFNQPAAQAEILCWSLMGILALRALGLGNWVFDRALSVANL